MKKENFWLKLASKASSPDQSKIDLGKKLNKPFFSLAPMYDVTDEAFRQMFVKYGKPDVLFTEFVSADGLANETGRAKLLRELYFTKNEQPIVAQIFGSKPETMATAGKLIKDLGFAGVDINMGCPDRAVEKQGAGSALIKNPDLTVEIIEAVKKAVGADFPVSVKTRIGYNKIDTENWAKILISAKPSAITFHLRTRKELSEAKAHFDEAEKVAKLCQEAGIVVLINGDIKNVAGGKSLAEKYYVDGIMIGRGAFGKPWLFANLSTEPALPEKLKIMVEHAKLFYDLYGPTETNQKLFNGHQKNFAVMRKHFKAYVSGFKGATDLRAKLMQTENANEVEDIVSSYLVEAR